MRFQFIPLAPEQVIPMLTINFTDTEFVGVIRKAEASSEKS